LHDGKGRERNFNGAALIAKEGEVIYQACHGWVDASKNEKVDTLSRFNVGSFSKEIVAIAIYDLMVGELLSYDDTVDQFLKDLPVWSKKITISQLLFYKSGLPLFNFRKVRNDNQALIYLKEDAQLVFEPGKGYLYSNWNNFILAKIIEEVTQVEFKYWI